MSHQLPCTNYLTVQYESEREIDRVMELIDSELSEPYSIFTYRYFLNQWPFLCHIAVAEDTGEYFGCIIGKMDLHKNGRMRGYIGMLTVKKERRHLGVGSNLVRKCIDEMLRRGCQEIVLEAEVTNSSALKLYQNLGFIRDKRLRCYYLNGNDAYRLKLRIPHSHHADSPTFSNMMNTLRIDQTRVT